MTQSRGYWKTWNWSFHWCIYIYLTDQLKRDRKRGMGTFHRTFQNLCSKWLQHGNGVDAVHSGKTELCQSIAIKTQRCSCYVGMQANWSMSIVLAPRNTVPGCLKYGLCFLVEARLIVWSQTVRSGQQQEISVHSEVKGGVEKGVSLQDMGTVTVKMHIFWTCEDDNATVILWFL